MMIDKGANRKINSLPSLKGEIMTIKSEITEEMIIDKLL